MVACGSVEFGGMVLKMVCSADKIFYCSSVIGLYVQKRTIPMW